MHDDDAVDETVMLTRRGRRSREADAAAPAAGGDSTTIDENTVSIDERTVAVSRRRAHPTPDVTPTDADAGAPVDERTIAIDRRATPHTDAEDEIIDDRTVAVSRRRSADPSPEPEAVDDSLDDRTVAVARDATTSIDRSGLDVRLGGEEPIEDRTVVIDRTAAEQAAEDHTVVVDRSAAPASASPELVSAYAGEDLDATVPAAPPRVVDAEPTPAIYKPRAAPRRPSRPPVIQGEPAPTREFDGQAVSLVRRARRVSLWSLLSVLGACVVSVAGLITLAYVVFA